MGLFAFVRQTALGASGHRRADDEDGMDVTPCTEGYEIMAEVEEIAKENAKASGGKFTKTNSMKEAFEGADFVYPKSWAPFKAMEKRTELYGAGDFRGINKLEKELRPERSPQGLGVHRGDDESYEGRQGTLPPLPAR